MKGRLIRREACMRRTVGLVVLFWGLLGILSAYGFTTEEKRIVQILGEIRGELSQLNRRFEDLNRRIEDTNRRIDDLRQEMNARFAEMDKRLEQRNARIEDTNETVRWLGVIMGGAGSGGDRSG